MLSADGEQRGATRLRRHGEQSDEVAIGERQPPGDVARDDVRGAAGSRVAEERFTHDDHVELPGDRGAQHDRPADPIAEVQRQPGLPHRLVAERAGSQLVGPAYGNVLEVEASVVARHRLTSHAGAGIAQADGRASDRRAVACEHLSREGGAGHALRRRDGGARQQAGGDDRENGQNRG